MAAVVAMVTWDGVGEPSGWARHPHTNRYRPDGNADQEYFGAAAMDLAKHAAEMLAVADANPIDPMAMLSGGLAAARKSTAKYSRCLDLDGEKVKVMLTLTKLPTRDFYTLSIGKADGGRLDREGTVAVLREAFLPGSFENPSPLGVSRQFVKFAG